MYDASAAPEAILDRAISILEKDENSLLSVLDELLAPIYVTDADGLITYFNPACINFAGRKPIVGQDRWCVTWKLYTDDGEFLPHDRCPMAEAIQQKRPVRGAVAIAERPDGTRVHFVPYPTPLFARDGTFRGAVNMLIDVSDKRQAASLREQAARCRRLARIANDRQASDALTLLAEEYETKALTLESLH
jgi:PAS domain S-box-containing protein